MNLDNHMIWNVNTEVPATSEITFQPSSAIAVDYVNMDVVSYVAGKEYAHYLLFSLCRVLLAWVQVRRYGLDETKKWTRDSIPSDATFKIRLSTTAEYEFTAVLLQPLITGHRKCTPETNSISLLLD